jgi:carboxypeptidase family protein/TonB-dependent receptor-like protein
MCKRGLLLIGLLLMTLGYPAGRLLGQAVYGSIIGTVTDSSGAAVPNAKVTITDVNKGVSYNTTSNESGNYAQQHLIVGVYDVKVETQGFEAFVQKGVQLNVDATVQVNAILQLGQVTQTVEVTAAVPLLKTEKTDVATSFSTQQVEDLPIFNRNFTQFELLTPGTQRLGWQHAASENPQGSIQIMVNGQHFSGTSFQLDGTDNQDPILGIIIINPNLDSVTEAKVTTQDYDAEFGEATAGVVTSQTKSGTNDLHGSAFEFRRNNVTSARDPFLQSTSNVPNSLWNQFGGSLGGPIKKDKTFIFGDFQGTRRKLGGSNSARVPTLAERGGDFSDFLNLSTPAKIYDPFDANGNIIPCTAQSCNRQPFQGNVIPSAMLSPQALALLKLIPPPNLTTTDPNSANFVGSGDQTFNSDGFDVRADQYQTEKLHMFGRYSFQRYSRQGPGLFGELVGGPAFNVDPSVGGFAGSSNVRNQSIAYGFDYTLSPEWLTDFRFGFMRYRVFVNPNGLGTSPAKDAGIPGLNLDNYFTSGMPSFFIDGQGGFSWGYSLGVNQCNCPLNEQEQQFQFVNNWTRVRGNHDFKFGADIRFAENLRVPSDTHRSGELHFSNSFTEGPAGANAPGLGLATFLLGNVTQFGRYVSNVTDAAERQKRWFFYGQDTFRVTPRLTVNYGLRWEIYFPQTVNGPGKGGWVQAATGEVWVDGVNGIASNGNVQNSYRNFAPRLGIAYQMNSKTVLRLGYGRSFDIGTFGSIFGHTVTQNLPVLANQQVNSPANWSDVFSLNQGPPALDPNTILQNNCNAITLVTAAKINGTQCLGVTGNPLLPDGVSPHIHPKRQRMLTADAWNVSLQHSFTNSLSGEVAYVGNKGTHIFNGDGPNYDINTPTIVGFAQGVPTNLRRPFYSLYGWTQGLNYYGNDASNHYESLQTKLEKRFSNGYTVAAHYTFAHAFQYDGDGYYIYNPKLVSGPSDFQRNHVFVLSHIYDLPFGKGRKYLSNASRALDYAVGGWELNGTWTWMSGLPYTPTYNECGSDIDTGPCIANLTGSIAAGTRSGDPNTLGYWYQTTGGTALATNGQTVGPWGRPAIGTFGNGGINSLRGPRFFDADLSLFKNFQITEKLKGQFRAESFNALNHVNLSQPNGCVDCSNAGSIFGLAAGAGMRVWQFGLRFDF